VTAETIDLPAAQLEAYAEPAAVEITEPGVYDIPAPAYHRDPVPGGSLSHSGAKKLLNPSCPAIFDYERKHPTAPTDAMEFGTAAHTVVLGSGPELVVVDAKDWKTKDARDERDEARARGQIALLPHEFERVHAMARALRRHRLAASLLDPDRGFPEQSLFWRDELTGVMLRARLDWLPESVKGRRLVIPDYKTAASVDDESIAKSIQNFGYHTQDDWYSTGAKALGLAESVAFLFVFQSKTPPYLVRVVGIPDAALAIAAGKNRKAIDVYAACMKSGRWPAYDADDADPPYINLPGWAESRDAQEYL
jgi:hypothetical protein